ncbi:putative oxidoreductase [Aspergillus bombycis]|uniref:Putative oxidoreductase n=1 Tax=Aspergillus bombycis TaxID=109264 RepID=A0A1F8AB24_9EURO|nr:putative oxidoreductase [Aspergillus bombycis]OGM48635.1 putative oxidoreductase [Aspergillus bombycis]
MFDLTADLSEVDHESLNRYHHKPPDFTRYKSIGTTKTEPGKFDHIHVYSVAQDDMLGNTSSEPQLPHPGTITRKKAQTRDFISRSHAVLDRVLASLDTSLGITPGTLSAMCPPTEPSGTLVRLIWTPPSAQQPDYRQISFGSHTDMGIMTLLFNVAGGLQVLPPGAANVDANWQLDWGTPAQLPSSGRDGPGAQAMVTRRSVAYLLRPRQDASLARFVGGIVPPLQPGEENETRHHERDIVSPGMQPHPLPESRQDLPFGEGFDRDSPPLSSVSSGRNWHSRNRSWSATQAIGRMYKRVLEWARRIARIDDLSGGVVAVFGAQAVPLALDV